MLFEIQNYQQALTACEIIARNGSAEAQYRTGMIYRLQDQMTLALGWLSRAAEQGYIKACHQLGQLYAEPGSPFYDAREAYAWFDFAARQGDEASTAQRDLLVTRMSKEQLDSAQQHSQLLDDRLR